MKNILLLIGLSLVFISCEKKYEIFGDLTTMDDMSEPNNCILEEIYISQYFNSIAYISDFEIDNNGILWVATSQGLLKKNGNSSYIYNTTNTILEDNYLHSVTIDNDNNIWISTYDGLYRYSPNSNQWEIFNEENCSFQNNNIEKVIKENSELFVTDSYNLYYYNNGAWTDTIKIYDITGIHLHSYLSYPGMAKEGTAFWFSTNEGLLKYENDSTWEFFSTSNSDITDNNIRKIYIDQNGRKWMETDSGVEMFDDDNWHMFDYMIDLEIEDDLIIADHNTGYLYIYMYDNWYNTLLYYDDAITTFEHVRYDSEGYLWLSSYSRYIYKLVKDPW